MLELKWAKSCSGKCQRRLPVAREIETCKFFHRKKKRKKKIERVHLIACSFNNANEAFLCSKLYFYSNSWGKISEAETHGFWGGRSSFWPTTMPITKEIDVRVAINSPDSLETPRAIRIDKRLVIRLHARARPFSIELLSQFNEPPFNIYGKLRWIRWIRNYEPCNNFGTRSVIPPSRFFSFSLFKISSCLSCRCRQERSTRLVKRLLHRVCQK